MPRIAVFAGRGSSHSWTWSADFLERMGEYRARFLDSREFIESLRHGFEVALVSGGDGYAIAESMRGDGFSKLKEFVSRGGRYVGICAGAYLPLPSSIPPFSEFNLSTSRIENIDCSSSRAPEPSRLSVPYGRCSIIHPVRGDVELSLDGSRMHAPLYGGPIFREPEKDAVLLRYVGFGTSTEFQVDRGRAEGMVMGRPAAVLCEHGRGTLMLFGPHLEHPKYPEANEVLRRFLGLAQPKTLPQSAKEKPVPGSLARSIADLKVATMGLEGRTFLVGKKVWDASRFMDLIQAIEKRSWSMGPPEAERVGSDLDSVRGILLRTEVGVESDIDEATALLVGAARMCVDSHFRSMVEGR